MGKKINGRSLLWWVGVSGLDARVNAHVDPMALSAAGVVRMGMTCGSICVVQDVIEGTRFGSGWFGSSRGMAYLTDRVCHVDRALIVFFL